MSNAGIYAEIAIGVAIMVETMVYAYNNQQKYLPEDAVSAPASEQGSFSSEDGLIQLNKEQWHDDPFGDRTAKVRAAYKTGR